MNDKTITFLLPGVAAHPVGGVKVIFEYANRLASDGYAVNIVYPILLKRKSKAIKCIIVALMRYFKYRFKSRIGRSWFDLDKKINEIVVLDLRESLVPPSDIFVASAVDTAYYLNEYQVPLSNKFYLIQDFEDWGVTKDYVEKSYSFGFKNIAISKWLAQRVRDVEADCCIIPNGFDFNYFKYSIPIEDKDKYKISMLYHRDERKGCEYGIAALRIVKRIYPQLRAVFFGVPKRPSNLPEWIDYYQSPDRDTHNKIYNECAINLAPSLQEGWGLTVGEAMMCGEAIVCTDTLGFQEMITNGKNGFIVQIKSPEKLAEKILLLIEDDELRKRLARSALDDIGRFRWDDSYRTFKELINKSLF